MFDGICRFVIHKHIPRKQLVVKNGDAAEEAFIVAKGAIDVEIGNGIVVFNFKPGDFFGDYGLQEDGAKRTADCRARTEVDVICIPRQTYIKYMMKFMYGNRDLKKKFFGQKLAFAIYPTKPEFDDASFAEQMNWMVAKSFNKGEIIGKQGHPSKKIFWVANGFVRVLKTITVEGEALVCDVGHYRQGQAFGANYTSINETNVHTWAADGPTTLYMISRADFQRMFGLDVVKMYTMTTNMLDCPVRELRKSLKNQRIWNDYKKSVVDLVTRGGRTEWLKMPENKMNRGASEILCASAQRNNNFELLENDLSYEPNANENK
jgi:CRP-like cAMP-binding protein